MNNENWRSRAACRNVDPDLFFPAADDAKTIRAALEICEGCPVRRQCGEYADTHRVLGYSVAGVWGGRMRTIYSKPGRRQ